MCSRSLQTLNLGHNRLTNEGIHTLKEGLLRNHSLQRLGLLNTRISSEGTGITAAVKPLLKDNYLSQTDSHSSCYIIITTMLFLSLKVWPLLNILPYTSVTVPLSLFAFLVFSKVCIEVRNL